MGNNNSVGSKAQNGPVIEANDGQAVIEYLERSLGPLPVKHMPDHHDGLPFAFRSKIFEGAPVGSGTGKSSGSPLVSVPNSGMAVVLCGCSYDW
ncbi:MAG: hypothetical protein U0231_16360 [Nitrospiraceae bacterium]